MLDGLLERFLDGDRLALSRLITFVAVGDHIEAIQTGLADRLRQRAEPARVLAITGSAGVGKSSLVGKLIAEVRQAGEKVAVLACDPQSPLSGGALLGDRFRMPDHADDEDVYIRSLAAVGGHGALADHLPALIELLEAFGFDVILLETVGAGQGDTVVRDVVDAVVVLLQPETGDDLQWEKAGLVEVADVLVIHKSDLPGADNVEAQVLAALSLSDAPRVPVKKASSRTGEGIPELWQTLSELPLRRSEKRTARDLLLETQELLAIRFGTRADSDVVQAILARWQAGEIDAHSAAAETLVALAAPESSTSKKGSNS